MALPDLTLPNVISRAYRRHVIPDEQGQDVPDVSAARREAIQSARELLAGAIRAGQTSVPDAS
jgi:hypothetical protein